MLWASFKIQEDFLDWEVIIGTPTSIEYNSHRQAL